MALTDDEKDRVRYHLGYPSVSTAATLQFGLPAGTQPSFLLEFALNNLLPTGEERVRDLLTALDSTEQNLLKSQRRLAAKRLGDLELRPAMSGHSEPDALEREHTRWANRLADVLGVPIYVYASRFAGTSGVIPRTS